jgi:hypothetical protein
LPSLVHQIGDFMAWHREYGDPRNNEHKKFCWFFYTEDKSNFKISEIEEGISEISPGVIEFQNNKIEK